jgi:hypothetical protein
MSVQEIESMFVTAAQGVPLRRFTRGQFLDFVLSLVQDIISKLDLSNLTDEQKRAVLDAIQRGFEMLRSTIDIPYVPEPIESWVELQLVWPIVERVARRALGI